MTFQSPRTFNTWLRGQLKEKKMSQRQLALQSGVDHSTISRLIKGDRMPSLGTATKLARGLREIRDEAEGPGYFASVSSRQVLPTTRVEYALRGDELRTESDVRELMQAYFTLRTRRLRNGGNNAAPGLSRGA
jgi:transcriptional regulator with XRE-family HTH domain